MRVLALLGSAYSAGLLVLTALHVLAAQRHGPLAVSQVGAPHLVLPLVVLVPLAALRLRGAALVVVLAGALVGALRLLEPPHILADVTLPGGQSLVTLAAHALPPRFDLRGGMIPVGYYAGERDHGLARLRAMVDPDLAAGRPVLLLGDFNVTDREPAYGELVAGLRDAHRAAGIGPGSTQRPHRLAWLPFGILRIDHVFAGGTARPLATSVDCAPAGGDHCQLSAVLAVEAP